MFIWNKKFLNSGGKQPYSEFMNRSVVVVIDSFGVGAMRDVPQVRPADLGSNTAWHLIDRENLRLPNLEKLGIMNAIGKETELMKKNPEAVFAVSNLKHFGADTYQGHQEIIGTKPVMPVMECFGEHIDETEKDLTDNGYSVERFEMNGNSALVVNGSIFVGDNMETDLGQVINVSGTFKYTTFEEVKKVGHIVRKHYGVSRIIALGGEDVEFKDILAACFTNGKFIGLNTPKSGVYKKGYLVQHIGCGVDCSAQAPFALNKIGIPTHLYGKTADIIDSDTAIRFFGVDTAMLMDKMIDDLRKNEPGFYFLNVQETDLAGHSCDEKEYVEVLKVVDAKLEKVLGLLSEDDLLIVMADHGNDPYSGRNLHTREQVPVLVRYKNMKGVFLGERETMADVGQTVCHYHGTSIANGKTLFDKF